MTPEERQSRRDGIVDAVRSGQRIKDVATSFGVTCGFVRSCAGPLMSQEERRLRASRIVEAVRGGSTREAVAAEFDVTADYVRRCCSHAGICKGRATFRSYEVIASLINTTKTLTEIAGEYGVTKQAIHGVYQKCLTAGIPVHRRDR